MASKQSVKGGTDPGTTPARRGNKGAEVRYASPDDAERAKAIAPARPLPPGTKARTVKADDGRGCRVVLVAPVVEVAESDPREGLDDLERYVLLRLEEAGDTLRLMPGIGTGYSEREFPLPTAEAISRMDEVLQEWMLWLKTTDERRVVGWFIAGLSWRKAAKKDPHGRSYGGLRKMFLRTVGVLALELVARTGKPPKWLLTELTKRG